MKFIVFVQTAKQEQMLLILNGGFWILMKIDSWVFQGWTQVLISLVFSVFTTDTAVCHRLQVYWLNILPGVGRDQTISVYPGKFKKITQSLFECDFYQNLAGA